MGGVDVDGDNLITIIDLFLVITIWFAFSFSMLLCYFVFDTFDRMRRNRDIELGKKILIKDFDYFTDRRALSMDKDVNKYFANMLTALTGNVNSLQNN